MKSPNLCKEDWEDIFRLTIFRFREGFACEDGFHRGEAVERIRRKAVANGACKNQLLQIQETSIKETKDILNGYSREVALEKIRERIANLKYDLMRR